MKNIKKYILLALTSGIYCFPAFADTKIAVLPFNVPENQQDIKQFSMGTMASITYTLSNIPNYTVIERGQIDAVLRELGFENSGLTDTENSIKAGKLSGVDVLVLGTIQALDKIYRINLNLTDVKTGKIIKSFQVTGSNIFELQDKLSSELLVLNANPVKINQVVENPITTKNEDAYNYYIKAITNSYNLTDINKLEGSIKLLDKALEIDKSYSLAAVTKTKFQAIKAYLLKYDNQDYSIALNEAENSINIFKDNNSAEIYLANYLISDLENKTEERNIIAEKVLKINSSDFINLIDNLSNYLNKKSMFTKSEDLLKEVIRLKPDSINTYNNLALVYSNQNRFDEAIAVYKKVIEIDNNFFIARSNLASIYNRMGKYDEAINENKEVIKMIPDDKYAIADIAMTLNNKGDYEEALIYIKRYLELAKDDINAFNYSMTGEIYFNLKKYDESLGYYQKALAKTEPKYKWDIYNRIAEVYKNKGQYKEAIENYNQSIAIKPDYDSTYVSFTELYVKMEQYDKAIETLNISLKFTKNRAYHYFRLYEIYILKNEPKMAIEQLKLVLNVIKKEADIKEIKEKIKTESLNFGIKSQQSGQLEDAVYYYQEALKVIPEPDIYNNLGVAYYSLKKYNESIEQYKKAIEIKNNYPDAHNNLGIVYQVLGQKSDSDIEYKKACDLGLKSSCR